MDYQDFPCVVTEAYVDVHQEGERGFSGVWGGDVRYLEIGEIKKSAEGRFLVRPEKYESEFFGFLCPIGIRNGARGCPSCYRKVKRWVACRSHHQRP